MILNWITTYRQSHYSVVALVKLYLDSALECLREIPRRCAPIED
jgi:hypothetical protein